MINEIYKQKILISPLNWGMGHVSRCIGIISQLLHQNNTVIIACSTIQKNIFIHYFPDLLYIEHEEYPFKFKGKGNFGFDLISQFIHLSKRHTKELKEVNKYVEEYKINLVLSDHRYGFYSSKCKSIFITHQLNLPLKWYEKPIDFLHKFLLKKFDCIWVLDTPESKYAGKLSKNNSFTSIYYIGLFSRFSIYDVPKIKSNYETVIVSGPPPYAEQFFHEQLTRSRNQNTNTLFIIPQNYTYNVLLPENSSIIYTTDWKKIDSIILNTSKIISRSGYSTLMDVAILKIPSLYFPTPGQNEQIYLAILHNTI